MHHLKGNAITNKQTKTFHFFVYGRRAPHDPHHTATSPPPQIEDRLVDDPLLNFRPATVDEVTQILMKSPAKQCSLDPVPTWLVKCHSDIFAPVVTDICNASFQQVKFPQCCKTAIIRPRLKQRTLDPNDLGSYRPISNLGFLSKVVEKVVDARLAEHVNRHRLLPIVQSAYRPFHLTDMQGFRSGDPSDISVIFTGVEDCVSDVSSWSVAKRLQLNATIRLRSCGSARKQIFASCRRRTESLASVRASSSQSQSSVILAC